MRYVVRPVRAFAAVSFTARAFFNRIEPIFVRSLSKQFSIDFDVPQRWCPFVILEIFASKCNYALKLLWSAGLYLLDQTLAQFVLFSFLPRLLKKVLTLLIQLRDALFCPCNAVVDLGRSTQRLQPPDKSESFGRSDSGSC